MEVAVVIPAHLGSTRLSAKVLRDLCGKTILERVYERAKKAKQIKSVYIATSDSEIIEAAEKFKAQVIKTEKKHLCGTSRVSEAALKINEEIIINVQADEPFISWELIDQLSLKMAEDKTIDILTAVKKIDKKSDIENPNVVKTVFDKSLNALYFSRSAIPYESSQAYKHVGIYCFRRSFLIAYPGLEESPQEKSEKLEQLRFLWNGYKIKVLITEFEGIGIDSAEDLERAKELLKCKK